MSRELLKRAIRLKGSEAKLGKACGVSQNAIWQAKVRGNVSALLAMAIERATDGEISKSALRPDLWPAEQEQAAS